MTALADTLALLGQVGGPPLDDLTVAEVEGLIDALPADLVQMLLDPIIAEEEYERFHRFDLLFPDDGPFRRELYPRHLEFFAAGKQYRERCFLAANRVGKAQPNDEPVLTPGGWKAIGDLSVHDLVISSDGKATRVTGIFPQGRRPVVHLIAADGASARCDVDHLWTVRPVKDGRLSPYRTMTAGELQARVGGGERWMLPQRPTVEFAAPFELPADPYLIGLLLGDGGLSTDRVLLSTVDEETIAYAKEQAGYWGCELRKVGSCTWHFATLVKRGGRHHNLLRAVLDGLGMAGKTSHTKRIPPQYLFATEHDRRSLLQGLMDTDGSCGKSNGARQFYSVNRDLCEDVAGLARSLGMNASVRAKNGRYNGEVHQSWKVHIASSPGSVFRLARKRANERHADVKMRGVMVQAIQDAGESECTCIEVEAADHLYVTKDYLVTHNTVAGGYEVAAHLTGNYPRWWQGREFRRPVRAWAAGDTNETTRDIIQTELLGAVVGGEGGRKAFDGSGLVPLHCIGQPRWKAGVQDLADTVPIMHESGRWSLLAFKSFDQGRRSFQGTGREVIWLDEECPIDVYNECLMRTATTRGIILTTFTPLSGLTEHVLQFMPSDLRPAGI